MTAPMGANTQYATAIGFFSEGADSNLSGSGDDAVRIQYYKLVEDFYHNRPESFTVMLRGEEEDSVPIYIPAARKIVEACNRFTAVDWDYAVSADEFRGSKDDQATARRLLDNLAKREKLSTKFANNKRYGIIRGDAMFHITADPRKDQGKRISIHELDPSNAFPIMDPDVEDRVLGWHIVSVVQDPREDDPTKKVASRQTYLRAGVVRAKYGYELPEGANVSGPVTSETTLWTIGKWDDRNMLQEDLESVPGGVSLFSLPPQITSLPVYHWKNNPVPGSDFGLSEISGLETLLKGLNQAITDEDLTLILNGLGMYTTNAKPPVDAQGNEVPWKLGPGTVVEVGNDNNFNRVTGVSSVQPYQDHMKYLEDAMLSTTGIPEVAAGRVDVTVAESGISLKLQLAPILAKSAEKELEILATMDHMLYDLLQGWFPAYEQVSLPLVTVSSVVGNPVPENRDAIIQEVMLLQAAGLITIEMAQAKLTKLGYEFQTGDNVKVLREAAAMAAAKGGDEFANRYAEELENAPESQTGNPVTAPVATDPASLPAIPNIPAPAQ